MAGFTNPYSKPTSAGKNPYAAPSRPQASAAQPGQAQSIPPRPQGTPYQSYTQQAQSAPSKPQGTPYQAYSQGGQSAAGGYQGFDPSMGRPTLRPSSQQVTGDWQGGYASAPPSQRPPAFQAGPAQTPWGQSADPFADRNAFINQVNQQRMQNQIAFNSSGPTNPADQMTPGINYQQAMQQAGLGGGSPSMSSDYGDSLIQRLNQNFGGQGEPFTFANQQAMAPPQSSGLPVSAPQGSSEAYAWKPFGPVGSKSNPGPGADSPVSAVGQPPQAPTGPANPRFAGIYAPDTDITKLPFTDTMRPNPAYRQWGAPSPGPIQPTQPEPAPPQGGEAPRLRPTPSLAGDGGYNPGWAVMPAMREAMESLGAYENLTRYPRQPQGPSYQQPANGTIRTDPDSGKMVTYENGQWTWRPNPISGPQPYDTSRFGDGTPQGSSDYPIFIQPPSQPQYGTPPELRGRGRTADWRDADRDGIDDRDQDGPGLPSYWGKPANPVARPGQANPIQPPSQGTPYQPPSDPYAVTDLKSLPFYKSLRVGETVRKRETGQYDVYNASGKPIETYSPGRVDPSIITKGAVREPLFLYQNEGMTDQQLRDIQSQRDADAKRRAAGEAWVKGAPARLEKEREYRRNTLIGKQVQATIDKMQAEVSSLERNLSKGSLEDKRKKLQRISQLKSLISQGAAKFF